MKELEKFIKEWKRAKSPASFLEKGLEFPDVQSVQVYLDSLPDNEAENIRADLTAIVEALEEQSLKLARQMEETKGQIKSSKSAREASLAYTKADKRG